MTIVSYETPLEISMRTEKRKIGDIGEEVACRFLVKRGFEIVERNYLKKWGEIDIIARKLGELHFVEVKTLQASLGQAARSKDVFSASAMSLRDGSETGYRPEENVHPAKLQRLARTVQSYLMDKNVSETVPWQIDVVTVKLDLEGKRAKVGFLENIIV